MKWKVKKKKVKKSNNIFNIGDIKREKYFLIFPKKIGDYWYWLEMYTKIYEWEKYHKYERKPIYDNMHPPIETFTKLVKVEETGWKLKEIKIRNQSY